jgi:Leucine-rich repeat (LRR) protein
MSRIVERLRLGPACLNLSNGTDAHNVFDVEYLCQHLPRFQRLRTLQLDNLELDDGAAYCVLQACAQPTCTVRELDLSNNSIHNLDEVVDRTDVVCRLTHLNLAGNALGEFDVDYLDREVSVGTCLTCGALAALLSHYTSLKHLDLSTNSFHNAEVRFLLTCCLRYLAI